MFSKSIQGKKIIYKDKNNEIEVLINEEPILDVDNLYSLEFFLKNKDFLYFILTDIKKNYKSMYYLTKEFDQEFEDLITSYNFKITSHEMYIPYQNQIKKYKLTTIKNMFLWEDYMLENINKLFRENSKYLENKEYKEYSREHLQIMIEKAICEELYLDNKIIGGIAYNLDNEDFVYVYDIYANNKEILKEMLEMILSKYPKKIKLNIVFMYQDLRDVVKSLNGKIKRAIYVWKRNDL